MTLSATQIANAQTAPPTAAASPSISQLTIDLQSALDAYVRDRGATEHLSSLSLSVSLGKTAAPIEVVSGKTSYGGSTPVTPSSLYQIGSNTKAFTAVAILQLEAQGRLSIDAPIGRYLPQYPAYGKITLRQLLHMIGGLDTYDDTPAWYVNYVKNPMADVSADSLIRLVYPKIKSTPGTQYQYSNTGFVLAEQIVVARSASHNFETEMTRVIRGAGLNNTFYSSHLYPSAIAKRVVAGYYENDDPGFKTLIGKDMTPYSLSWARGAGAVVSTPSDLAKWARQMYQPSALLPAKQKAELLSLISTKTAKPIDVTSASDPAGFGLGVAQRTMPGLGTFWFYQGETLGFRAAHLYFPKSDLVVSVFANSRPEEKNSDIQSLFMTIDKTIHANGF